MNLEVRPRGSVCELRLNAPPGNVIDRATCEAMAAAVREHAQDRHLKAFLLTGEGKHFSYGASVPEHALGEVEKFLPRFHGLFLDFVDASVPVVAAVQGLCLGGALELAAFSNILVAEESATFAVPEITLGVLPPAACVLLPWRVGGAVAEDLILTGRRMQAAEGQACGLVSRVCPDGALSETVQRLLEEQIQPLSAATLRHAVKAARAPLHGELRVRLPALETLYLDELMASSDAREGIAAFLEKRKPVWEDA